MGSPASKNSEDLVENSSDNAERQSFPEEEITEKLLYSDFYHSHRVLEMINTMRIDNLFCDVILQADDGSDIQAHKMILSACSSYFHIMFTKFEERDEKRVKLKGVDHTTLELLVNYIYTTRIEITEGNVLSLLSAANLYQFVDIQDACCDFLKTQLCPSNCLGIRALADLYGCTKLLKYADDFIEQYFTEVLEEDEFLSLAPQQVAKLISNDRLTIPSEEKIFEGVMSWVQADLKTRRNVLSELMKHVRLPLLSEEYLHQRVMKEPLLESILQCKDFLNEALEYHLLGKKKEMPCHSEIKRRGRPKVLLAVGGDSTGPRCVKYFDFESESWYQLSDLPTGRCCAELTVLGGRVYAIGGCYGFDSLSLVEVYDSTNDEWTACSNMNNFRLYHGVGVVGNRIYAIGGENGTSLMNSGEVYDPKTNEWQKIASMSTARSNVGVGVVDGFLYAVGGHNFESNNSLASVECYNPEKDEWTPVAEMSVRRSRAAVGALNGILYSVGGWTGKEIAWSAEAYDPKTNQWRSIANMAFPTAGARMVVFNEKLYVVGNEIGVQVYTPGSNSWSTIIGSVSKCWNHSSIAIIDKPLANAIPWAKCTIDHRGEKNQDEA